MRLQVMHLPAPEGEYPFLLVLDEVGDTYDLGRNAEFDRAAKESGARAGIAFAQTVEVL